MKRLYSNIGIFRSDSKIATSFSFRDRPKTSAILPLFRVLICNLLVLRECLHLTRVFQAQKGRHFV